MNEVLIVAGFGRCGSSLMMQMLQAGGFPCFGSRPAYEDDVSMFCNLTPDWLNLQRGKAVKILDPQLADHGMFFGIPRIVIWLDRDPEQQAKSFIKFGRLVCGLPFSRSAVRPLAKAFLKDRPLAHKALGIDQCKSLHVKFEDIIHSPHDVAAEIANLLYPVQFDQARAAKTVVRRNSDCLSGLLELPLLSALSTEIQLYGK